jgi:nucleotide-binding universal stress UspA family protein
MLALSTFRRSEDAVQAALERAAEGGELVVVYVADVNLARYFVGTDVGLYPELEETCEKELLERHLRAGQKRVAQIVARAERAGIATTTHVEIGRFARVCLGIVGRERPGLIVTTRSDRPKWVRRFFGSPVDRLKREAGCPVIEA